MLCAYVHVITSVPGGPDNRLRMSESDFEEIVTPETCKTHSSEACILVSVDRRSDMEHRGGESVRGRATNATCRRV